LHIDLHIDLQMTGVRIHDASIRYGYASECHQ
jgi:hypothetical protein